MARGPASERTRNELKALFDGRSPVERSHLVRQAGTTEPFRSRIRSIIRGRTEELERLAMERYARGLSVRDIEAVFTDEAGRCLLTKSAASELTERLWADDQAVASRDLSEFKVLSLFVDGMAERLHRGQPREAVLAAWGITETGQQVLLGLAPGAKEDTASCRDFLRDLKARGLTDPMLGVTEGAPGLIRAFAEGFPRSLRPACGRQATVSGAQASQPRAHGSRGGRARSKGRGPFRYPRATAWSLDDFEACITHLELPIAHRRATRTTNLLERLFGEERRRTKVIPHALGERAVLKLLDASLMRASLSWQRLVISALDLNQLQSLRDHLNRLHAERTAPVKLSASRSRISSKNGT